jgi:tetratricopeptide (TPR) repeat protein
MTRLIFSPDFKLTLPITFVFVLSVGTARTLFGAQSEDFGSPPDVAEVHVGKGYELVKDRRYTEAAKEFEAALSLKPRLVRVRYQLAVCWFNVGQLKQSRDEFELVRRETGGDSSVTYYLGRIDLLEGNTESAIREFKSIVSAGRFEDAYGYVGLAYLKRSDLESAKQWLQKAAKATPRDPRVHDYLGGVYQKLGRHSEAKEEFSLAFRLRQRLAAAAGLAVDCGHDLATQPLAKAQTTCQQLFDPTDEYNLLTLGVLYGRYAYYEQALEPLQLAARLDPESVEIQYNLGLSYFRVRRYREARAPLEKAVALQPDFFGPNALLGATLYGLKEDELSYKVLQHAHRINPQHPETAGLLFRVSLGLGQKEFLAKKYTQSLVFLKEATALNPSLPEVHRLLAEVYSSLGQGKEAAHESKEAERLERTNPR